MLVIQQTVDGNKYWIFRNGFNVGQIGAALKSGRVNRNYAARDHNARQKRASLKHVTAYPGHAVGNGYVPQTATVTEGFTRDFFHTVRDPDFRKSATALKGPPLQAGHALPDTHRPCFPGRAVDQLGIIALIKTSVFGSVSRVILRNRNYPEACAIGEGRRPDLCHAARDGYICQAAAVIKRVLSDGFQAVGELHPPQACAMTERIIPYMGQTGRDRDIRQAVTSAESQVTNNGHTFRDSHAFQNFTFMKRSSAYFSHGLSVNDPGNENLRIVSLIAFDRDPFTVFYPRKQPGSLHED